MNNRITAISFMATMLFACAFTFTGCKKDDVPPPEWVSAVVTDFRNGRFAPELEDVLPGAALGSTDVKSLSRYASGSSVFPWPEQNTVRMALDDMQVVKASELRYIYEIDWVLDDFNAMRDLMEEQKTNSMLQLERSGAEKQNVWHNGFKYEETPDGDRMVYINKKADRVKLSMYAGGACEIYASTTTGSKIDVDMYSYFKGDKFIYLEKQTEGTKEEFHYFEFDQTNGIKKGTLIKFRYNPDSDPKYTDNGHKIWAYTFEGDDRYIEVHRHNGTHLIGSAAYSNGIISVVENGFGAKYELSSTGSETLRTDATALNIAEIYIEGVMPDYRTSVHPHSILLDNGEKLILDIPDTEMFYQPTFNYFLVSNIWDEHNQAPVKDEFYAGLLLFSRIGFSGSFNDILSARYPGLKAKNNLDYERYRPVANSLLSGIFPEVNTLKISGINVDKWNDFKTIMGGYIESKNTGF